MIPSIDEIEKLHRKYAPDEHFMALVYNHCQIVYEIASQIITDKKLSLNRQLVQAGALLHDIGAYKLITPEKKFDKQNYIKHGIFGYEILQSEGLDDAICEIARRHTGAGITKNQIAERNLPLPLMDYVARTVEERLVMYADKFHSKTPKFNAYETYMAFVAQYGDENRVHFEELANEFGIPDLQPLAAKYNQPIV